jgi:hypothetical protein
LKKLNPSLIITVATAEEELLKSQKTIDAIFNLIGNDEVKEVVSIAKTDRSEYQLIVKACDHISKERFNFSNEFDLYVDAYLNHIYTEEDRRKISNYDMMLEFLNNTYFYTMRNNLKQLNLALQKQLSILSRA